MAGTRTIRSSSSSSILSGMNSPRFAGRQIPKRGQVKTGIVINLAHSFASIFSQSGRRSSSTRFSQRN
ncbi:hypothetical protein MKW92_015776 [Papaver armeniacum]|nr:hypothetical protein MKW92_015776 [Papaver armeniacum]